MKHVSAAIIFLWILCTCTTVNAQTTVETYRIPEYHLSHDEACFGFHEFQELLTMDSDLHFADIHVAQLQDLLLERDHQVLDLNLALTNTQYRLDLFREDHARLFNLWTEENRRRHELEERPDAGSWVAWAVAGISLAAAVVFGVTLGIVTSGN